LERSEEGYSSHAAKLGRLARRKPAKLEQLGGKQQLGFPFEVSLGEAGLEQDRIVVGYLQRPNRGGNRSTDGGRSMAARWRCQRGGGASVL
jgi:hypothetical protein